MDYPPNPIESLATQIPVPLDRLCIPPELSGAAGRNRARRHTSQISADTDLSAVTAWLANYADVPATLAAYRKEVERLMLWSLLQIGKPISSLTHEDFLAYKVFLENPQPAHRWVLTGSKKKLARGHPDWRPFAGPLSTSSVRQALVIVNACFSWLTDACYLSANPLSLARRRRAQVKPRITRYLSYNMWMAVKETIESMPVDTDRNRRHAARCRWLYSVFYIGALRAAEVTGSTMGAFFSRMDVEGVERWWLEVHGKGGKSRLVAATDELIAELKRYRLANGLTPMPQWGDTTPLILPVIGPEKALSRGGLHLIVKEVFRRTAERLRAGGPDGAAPARMVERASAHWMRHTAGSHMTDKKVDVRYVRDSFGHSSLAVTSGYVHTEDDARHAEIQEKHRIAWGEPGKSR